MAPSGRYSGAWARKASSPTLAVPLHPATDPQHLKPEPNPNGGPESWVATANAPPLPADLWGEPFGTPVGGGGPIDAEPLDPNYGPGAAPGITREESRAEMALWHETDLGSVAARQYQALTSRADAQEPGNGPHVAVLYDTPGDGDSPGTLLYERSGVGSPIDPYARTGKRIARWWNRFIDMHWYAPEYRPIVDRYAVPQAVMPAVTGGGPLDSPYASNGPMRATPDGFVNPQLRRTPVPWDEPFTTDGTGTYAADPSTGLTSWGL